jgi:signal transduction histidine kinase
MSEEVRTAGAVVTVMAPLPGVRANGPVLSQVLANLLGNAMKFVAPGIAPRIVVRAEQEGADAVRLWIEDNGIGIPEPHQERIFGVFERLSPQDRYPGTGLGLAIVRRAVERMGGAVGVVSWPGQGSRFWVRLPRAPEM